MIILRFVSTLFLVLITLTSTLQAQTACNIIYVSTAGSPTAPRTMAQPTTLGNALQLSQSGDIIRLATGIYEFSNDIYLKDSVTIEGGFEEFNN